MILEPFSFAQANKPSLVSSLDVQQFKPAIGEMDILHIYSSKIPARLSLNVGFFIHYSHRPLRLIDENNHKTIYDLVKYQTNFDMMISIALFKRAEIGLVLPVIMAQESQQIGQLDPHFKHSFPNTGLGDLRLIPKIKFYEQAHGFSMGMSVPLQLPTGREFAFIGRGVSVETKFLFDYITQYQMHWALNLGYRFGEKRAYLNLFMQHEFTFGLGVRYLLPLNTQQRLFIQGNIFGLLGLKNPSLESLPIEFLLGVSYFPLHKIGITLDAGAGLTRGYGTPQFRVTFGFLYQYDILPRSQGDVFKKTPTHVLANIKTQVFHSAPDDLIVDKNHSGISLGKAQEEPLPILSVSDSVSIKSQSSKTLLKRDVYDDDRPSSNATNTDGFIKSMWPYSIYFDFDQSLLKPEALKEIKAVAQYIRAQTGLLNVEIRGYADVIGHEHYNLNLSTKRACNTKAFLLQAGVSDALLKCKGLGEIKNGPGNHALDRRVEIWLIR